MTVYVCETCSVVYRPPYEELNQKKGEWGYRKECPLCGGTEREALEAEVIL